MKVKKVKAVKDINEVLKGLLENKVVDGIIVPQEINGKYVQNLLVSPDKFTNSQPFMPVFNISAANFVTRWVGTDKKVGVVMKPCELRAVVELMKLKQIDPEKILLIGTDCYGAFNVDNYVKHAKDIGPSPDQDKVAAMSKKVQLRKACTHCSHHIPLVADIVFGRSGKGFFVGAMSDKGAAAMVGADLKEDDMETWKASVMDLDKAGKAKREKEFNTISEKLKSPEGFMEVFQACIGCQNCRVECPVCYCKECFFDKPINKPTADEMMMLAKMRNGLELPRDIQYFHIVRLNHMAISCVGCGMCDDSCPKNIPVSLIFECIGDDVQKEFDYEPGRDLNESIPMMIYKEDDPEPYGETP